MTRSAATMRQSKKAEERLSATGIDKFVTTLAEATEELAHRASSPKLFLANTGSTEAQAARLVL